MRQKAVRCISCGRCCFISRCAWDAKHAVAIAKEFPGTNLSDMFEFTVRQDGAGKYKQMMTPTTVNGRCIFQAVTNDGYSKCNLWYSHEKLRPIATATISIGEGCAISNGSFWNLK